VCVFAATDYQKHNQIHRFCATAAPRCSTAAQPSAAKKAAISSVIMAAKPKLKPVAVPKSVEDPSKVEKAEAERKIVEGHKTEQTERRKRVEEKKAANAVEATKTARTSAKQSTGGEQPAASSLARVAPGQKAGQAQAASAKPEGRWQTPLARLKDRLAELETKLHATQVVRLLALLVKKKYKY
jgi:hypothetical protein